MLIETERAEILRIWTRKIDQDARKLPREQRHRNLEPESAEFINTLASGLRAKKLLEIGGSSGLSTIALAAAARWSGGKLVSIEIEPERQAQARQIIDQLELSSYVDFVRDDAGKVLRKFRELNFVLIDCEKTDYIRFFDMLRLAPGAVVVADNILSHGLADYSRHVRSKGESLTLPIGKGLEVTLTGKKVEEASPNRAIIQAANSPPQRKNRRA